MLRAEHTPWGTAPRAIDQDSRSPANGPVIQRRADPAAVIDSADRQAESGGSTPGTAASALIIPDGQTPAAGQMARSTFLARLRSTADATASEVLGPLWSVAGCPYIKSWFQQHAGDDAAKLERFARRYAGTAATNSEQYLTGIAARLHAGIVNWSRGVSVAGNASQADAGAAPSGGLEVQAKTDGHESGAEAHDAQRVADSLGSGRPMDSSLAGRMATAFGTSFTGVRVHTDSAAARASSELGALAFTVGSDVAFADGNYQPGTPWGDALLAHELAHVVQQRSGLKSAASPSEGHEREADRAAIGVVGSIYGHGAVKPGILSRTRPTLRSGLALQSCKSNRRQNQNCTPETTPPAEIRHEKTLTHGTMKWHLRPHRNSSARMDVEFVPNAATAGRARTISLVQTVIFNRQGRRVHDDYGGGPSYEESSGTRVDFVREPFSNMAEDFDPFYGAVWDDSAGRWRAESERSRPWQRATAGGGTGPPAQGEGSGTGSSTSSSSSSSSSSTTSGATLHDQPSFNIAQDEEKRFETVAVVTETGERLGSLKWGFAYTCNNGRRFSGATPADCTDTPSAAFERALTKFNEQRYDVTLEGFAPGSSTLSEAHRRQLDTLIRSNSGGHPMRVGGAADGAEADPRGVSRQRADAVAAYLRGRDVTVSAVEAYGADWARVSTGPRASEGGNRRVQITVVRPPGG